MNQKQFHKHIETLNREMGEVKTDIEWIKEQLIDTKNYAKKISDRTFWILGGVVTSILIQIMFNVM
ncbi:MAG: hypothetical protein AABY15_09040 [Nanoarchaeota archaeon]